MSESDEERMMEYIKSIQDQIMGILNTVKDEVGMDVPIEVEVREVDSNE